MSDLEGLGQWGNDLKAEVVPDLPKAWDDWLIPQHRSLAERYVAGDLGLRVVFGWSARGGPPVEYEAVVHRAFPADLAGTLDHATSELPVGYGGGSGDEFAVLVDTAQLMKHPERIAEVVGPSLIRLKVLEQGLDPRPHVLVFPPSAVIDLLGGALPVAVPDDRELGVADSLGREFCSVVGLGIALGIEGEGQVVGGGSEVVDNVPDLGSPVGNRPLDSSDDGEPPGLGIVFGDEAVRVSIKPPFDGVVKFAQVVKRPLDLCPVAIHAR